LEQLPDYFTPGTHDAVRSSIPSHRTWVATDAATGDDVVGFLVAERRYPVAAEITIAAVTPEQRGRGIGTQLVEDAMRDLAASGVLVVEVKTLDESAGYGPYVATRAFWETCGFVQVDCIDPLPGWLPGNHLYRGARGDALTDRNHPASWVRTRADLPIGVCDSRYVRHPGTGALGWGNLSGWDWS
jgi:GNAT superfamily N-acetyltransferase